MADDIRTRPAPDAIDDGVPATEEAPRGLIETGDDGLGEVPPGDRPRYSVAHGVTAREQLEGASLEQRIREEEPDRVGRGRGEVPPVLFEPGAETGLFDDEGDMIADVDVGFDDTLAPEEAAIHVTRHPGGITDDDSPGYLDDES
jgi:hypothetical protein